MEVKLLSTGAAKGLVYAIQQSYTAETGAVVSGAFGAVGIMKDQFERGEACDVIILTETMIAELTRAGRIVPGSSGKLGRVHTGIAVRSGAPLPDISDPSVLRENLLAAAGICFPDPGQATAGKHFVEALRQLRIYEQLLPSLRPCPNGAIAMQQLARSREALTIGCAQVTEIKYTPGVSLVGVLPEPLGVATVYTAAVNHKAAQPAKARRLVELLSGADSLTQRIAAGFEV